MKKAFWNSVFLTLLTGCALFGGGNETLRRAKGYEVVPPTGWAPQSSENESDSAFRTTSGNIATVTSDCSRNAKASLDVLTRHLLLGARNITYLKREKFPIAGRDGQYSSVKTLLDGSPMFLELFVLPKSACVFDFSLVSNREIPEREKQDFLGFVKSFKYGND